MDSPKYALLLERLCIAADTHDWITFEDLLPCVQQAHEQYNAQRIQRGWQPVCIYPESWDMLNQRAHECVWN